MNFFILFYLIVAVSLLTLNPFVFQAYTPTEFWVWRFSIEDFARNVLLFLPFGLLLRHSFCTRAATVFCYGGLLSFCIEVAQLFIELRTSNFVDLISNSSGALVGALFCQWAFSTRVAEKRNIPREWFSDTPGEWPCHRTSLSIPLACLFIPLCWISAMRSLWTLPAVVTVFLSAIASLILIQSIPTPQPKKSAIALAWVSLCFLPVLNTNLLAGCLLLATIPLIIPLTARVRPANVPRIVVQVTAIACLLTFVLNGIWYFTNNAPGWTNDEHLRLSESLLATATLLACLSWKKRLKA